MSVSHSDFLESAKGMAQGTAEIDFRNAISRSYYSVYHRAKPISVLISEVIADADVGVHQQLIQRFKSVKTSTLQKSALSIAYVLETLRVERCNADYEISASFDREQLESHMHYVNRAMDQLTSFSNLISEVNKQASA